MDENFNSEHGFNCKYAEHKVGTNRYIFKYPETFYSSMNDRRLYFGLRSIIVKLEPLFLDFSKFTYVSLVAKYGYHLGDYYYELNNIYQDSGVKVEGTTNNEYLLTVRPSAGGQILYPERMPLDIRFTISPEMKMTEVSCEKGFCESGISTQSDHAGFDITNNYGNEFWED